MEYKSKSVARIRINEAEVRAIIAVLDIIKPNMISNFNGERQALATFRDKLTPIYKKLKK